MKRINCLLIFFLLLVGCHAKQTQTIASIIKEDIHEEPTPTFVREVTKTISVTPSISMARSIPTTNTSVDETSSFAIQILVDRSWSAVNCQNGDNESKRLVGFLANMAWAITEGSKDAAQKLNFGLAGFSTNAEGFDPIIPLDKIENLQRNWYEEIQRLFQKETVSENFTGAFNAVSTAFDIAGFDRKVFVFITDDTGHSDTLEKIRDNIKNLSHNGIETYAVLLCDGIENQLAVYEEEELQLLTGLKTFYTYKDNREWIQKLSEEIFKEYLFLPEASWLTRGEEISIKLNGSTRLVRLSLLSYKQSDPRDLFTYIKEVDSYFTWTNLPHQWEFSKWGSDNGLSPGLGCKPHVWTIQYFDDQPAFFFLKNIREPVFTASMNLIAQKDEVSSQKVFLRGSNSFNLVAEVRLSSEELSKTELYDFGECFTWSINAMSERMEIIHTNSVPISQFYAWNISLEELREGRLDVNLVMNGPGKSEILATNSMEIDLLPTLELTQTTWKCNSKEDDHCIGEDDIESDDYSLQISFKFPQQIERPIIEYVTNIVAGNCSDENINLNENSARVEISPESNKNEFIWVISRKDRNLPSVYETMLKCDGKFRFSWENHPDWPTYECGIKTITPINDEFSVRLDCSE